MTERPGDATPANTAAEAAAAMATLFQSLLRGLAHTLSNRVASLGAIADTLAADGTLSSTYVAALGDEAARLDTLLRLQRLLGGTGGEELPEPVHLPDVVPDLAALHALRATAREIPLTVDGDPSVLPVRVRLPAFAQAVLALLAAAAEEANGRADATITLRYGGDPVTTALVVEARWRTGAERPVERRAMGATPIPPAAALARVAEWLLADADARLTEIRLAGDAGVRWELGLPTLLELRRRARG